MGRRQVGGSKEHRTVVSTMCQQSSNPVSCLLNLLHL